MLGFLLATLRVAPSIVRTAPTISVRKYLSFVYFLILRFMTYVFLHLAATLCTLLAYYLAYPHVSLFPPSVKILYYSSCLSLLAMFLCCPTYANGVLVLFFNLNLIFSSFITRYLESIHQTWKCHYVAHIIDRFIAFLRNAFANCQVQFFSLHIMSPSFFDHSVNQAEPVCCK